MGALMRACDWSATPLGPTESWPQSLRSSLSICLNSTMPNAVYWGPDCHLLYNDAYSEILVDRHPDALGRRFRDVWPEAWPVLGPQLETVVSTGHGFAADRFPLMLTRQGALQETHWFYSFAPIRGEGGTVLGVFVNGLEITERVLAERRHATERDRLAQLLDKAPSFAASLRGPTHVVEFVNAAFRATFGERDFIGKTTGEAFPESAEQGLSEMLDTVYSTGERFIADRVAIRLEAPGAAPEERFLNFICEPVTDDNGQVTGIFIEGYDVTDAHRAEAGLQGAQERYSALFNAIEQGFCTIEVAFDEHERPVDYRFLEISPSFERQTGIENGAGRWMREIAPDQDQFWFDTYGHVALTGEPARFENYSTPLGRWWNVYAFRISGSFRVAVLFHDITDQKRSEAALRESEARFRLMADAVPQIVWITDRHGRMEFLNKRFVDYTGASYGTSVPADMTMDVIYPEDGERVVAAFAAALESGRPFEIEHRVRSSAGENRWFLARAEPFRDTETDKIVRWFGVSVDIHDRKQTEAALRASEARHRFRAELSDALHGLTTTSEIMATVAERLGRWLGVDQANYYSVEGDSFVVTEEWRTSASLGLLGRHSLPEFGERTVALVRSGGSLRVDDTRLAEGAQAYAAVGMGAVLSLPLRRDGRWASGLHVHQKLPRAWTDEEAELVAEVAARTWDAIERTRAEGELRTSELALRDLTNTLERRVVERTAELELAHEQLRQSQKLEAMGALTGGVAHDFNNLLTPIVGSLDLLQRRGLGGEREQRLISGAIQSADRARTLVQRLLAFARRQPLSASAVDVGRLVEGMADLLGSTTGPQVQVVVALAQDPPAAHADANQLEMALLNLGVNARDAMPDGGTLRIGATHESVVSPNGALKEGHYIRLSVADTGVGMDEATLARAVEPFFSTKGIGKGTGLGLSMAHGLAAQLGGALTIQSQPGTGTTIELWLPVSVAAARPEEVVTTPAVLGAVRGLALLVDDEDVVRESTADMLEEFGYDVRQAASAETALALVAQGLEPDLLVSDHLMPGMSGVDLARALRTTRTDLPVLIVSGYAEAEGIAPDLPRLTKPFKSAELEASLAALTSG
ncbi:PAS domain S-box-containing protein [Sphingomonas sp. OK281]|nr:PAS domain S-box-containing protein [Sphingomonas sp. OK281]